MRKITLFLLLLFTIQISAQIRRVAVFDFTNPTGLNPSITPRTDNGGGLKVSDKVFVNGLASISFVEGSQPTGAKIMTGIDEEWHTTSYCLRLTYTTQMIFSCTNGAEIDSIRISHDSVMGDLSLLDKSQPGNLDFTQGYELWKSESSTNINKIIFKNGPNSTEFKKIKVYYRERTAILNASFDLTDGSVYATFESLKLTFDRNVTLANATSFSVKDNNGKKVADLTASCSGKTATLSSEQPISDKGTYQIVIPAGSFKDTEGHVNEEQVFHFSITPNKNTFNYVSASPNTGKIDKLSDNFSITFADEVGYVDNTPLVLYKDGEPKRAVVMTKNKNQVIFNYQNVTDDLSEVGTYSISIPEGAIYNAFKGIDDLELFNKAFELTYVISDSPNPTPDPTPSEDSETLKQAKELLKNNGVGYPTTNSEAYLKLKDCIEAKTTPSDDELKALIEDYYNESDINLPENGKWYNIASVNSEGTKLYLCVVDGKLQLSSDVASATAFNSAVNNDYVVFTDINDNNLQANGISSVATPLTLKKMNHSEVLSDANKTLSAKDVLSVMTLYGYVGENAVGKKLFANALINQENENIVSDATVTDLYFTKQLTSGFVFYETTKPTSEVTVEQTTINITPDLLPTSNDKMSVILPNVEEAKLSVGINPYITTSTGEYMANATIASIPGKTNQFDISLPNLAKGKYCMVIPEGLFLYSKDGKQVKTQEYTQAFTIGRNGSGDDGGFSYTLSSFYIYDSPGQDIPVKDTFLNNLIIYIEKDMYSGLYADESKVVKLVNYKNASDVIRTGHFESCNIDIYNSSALKYVCDNPISEGELNAGMYTFIIEAGTFGDENFKKYLKDRTSVAASLCKVNPITRIHFTVDNDKATGIKEITSDSNKQTVIYDLMGRRVQNMNRPGIYIVNGKKVIKK